MRRSAPTEERQEVGRKHGNSPTSSNPRRQLHKGPKHPPSLKPMTGNKLPESRTDSVCHDTPVDSWELPSRRRQFYVLQRCRDGQKPRRIAYPSEAPPLPKRCKLGTRLTRLAIPDAGRCQEDSNPKKKCWQQRRQREEYLCDCRWVSRRIFDQHSQDRRE